MTAAAVTPAAVTTFLRDATAAAVAARPRGKAFLIVPLVLVNAAAIWGQAGWAYENIADGLIASGHNKTGLIVALLFASAIESIGVYLAYEAHEALMADQASGLLRAGSYAVGGLAGLLNYWHFAETSTAQAVAFAGLSAVSPWLWTVWSRARNRTRLAELGMADTRGVKLSTTRKVWHPVRSLRVMSWASWAGVTDPAEAVAGWERQRAATVTEQRADDPAPNKPDTQERKEEPSEPSGPTARELATKRILEIWAAEKTVTGAQIDREFQLTNYGSKFIRDLKAEGWGPGKVPPEYQLRAAS